MNGSHDGYVRLTLDEVLSVRFAHLISGLDEDAGAVCGGCTTITGYTEWIGKTDPTVTVGWDWIVEAYAGQPRWRRVGLPRTNVLLVDSSRRDYTWPKSLAVLGTVVDALAWQSTAEQALSERYATHIPESQPPKVSSFVVSRPSVQ